MTGGPKLPASFSMSLSGEKEAKSREDIFENLVSRFKKKKPLTFTSRAFSKLLKNVIITVFYPLRYHFRYLHPFAHL